GVQGREGRRGHHRSEGRDRAGHDQAGRVVLPCGGRRTGDDARCGRRRARQSVQSLGATAMSVTQVWAVVPAAGRGTRFGGALPKQYLQAGGQPLLAHTLESLLSHPGVAGVMVAIAENDADWPGWSAFADKPVLTCTGG